MPADAVVKPAAPGVKNKSWSDNPIDAFVLAKLEEIRSRLVTRPAMLVNVTLDDQNWQAFKPMLGDFLGKLPDKAYQPQTWPKGVPAGFQGLAIPSQVNFVAKAANIYANGFPLNGGMFVAGKYLVRTWIWNKVRVQGGAYSGRGALDQRSEYGRSAPTAIRTC